MSIKNLDIYKNNFNIIAYNNRVNRQNICIYQQIKKNSKKVLTKPPLTAIILKVDWRQQSQMVCGCSSMARISAFQADCVGSIPITRFSLYAPVAQLDRATAF